MVVRFISVIIKWMPMKKNSTICILKVTDKRLSDLSENEDKGPKSRTVDFLRQFARVYHAEPALDTVLGGYILS